VYLLKITVPYKYEWLDDVFKEAATFIFFFMTGYKFRPASNNPYFALRYIMIISLWTLKNLTKVIKIKVFFIFRTDDYELNEEVISGTAIDEIVSQVGLASETDFQ